MVDPDWFSRMVGNKGQQEADAPLPRWRRLLQALGPVRVAVAVFALLCLPLVLFSDTDDRGWGLIPGQVAPGLVVLLVWALPFDMLMARVFMTDLQGAARERYRTVIRIDALLVLALILVWGPFFLRLLR